MTSFRQSDLHEDANVAELEKFVRDVTKRDWLSALLNLPRPILVALLALVFSGAAGLGTMAASQVGKRDASQEQRLDTLEEAMRTLQHDVNNIKTDMPQVKDTAYEVRKLVWGLMEESLVQGRSLAAYRGNVGDVRRYEIKLRALNQRRAAIEAEEENK